MAPSRTHTHRAGNSTAVAHPRGNILITVLWVIVIMAILVLGLNYEARSDVERAILLRERSQAYWYARSGIERTKFAFAVSNLNHDLETERKSRFRFDFDGGYAETILLSSSSKLSVNNTDRDVWDQLFLYFGLDDQQREAAVDAVLDWRDEDDLERLNGAEDDYYQSLEPPYRPRNGPFHSIEEILLVRGVTEEMFYGSGSGPEAKPGLKDILTSSGPVINRFDLNSCPKAILMAFLDITEAEAQGLVTAREEQPFETVQDAAQKLPIEATEKINRFFLLYRNPAQFSIKSTGFVYNSAARYTVEDEVRFSGGGNIFTTMAHKDFSLNHVDETVPEPEEEER